MISSNISEFFNATISIKKTFWALPSCNKAVPSAEVSDKVGLHSQSMPRIVGSEFQLYPV